MAVLASWTLSSLCFNCFRTGYLHLFSARQATRWAFCFTLLWSRVMPTWLNLYSLRHLATYLVLTNYQGWWQLWGQCSQSTELCILTRGRGKDLKFKKKRILLRVATTSQWGVECRASTARADLTTAQSKIWTFHIWAEDDINVHN